MTIGERIRARRIGLGLTQRDIEAMTGLTNSYVSQLERRRTRKYSVQTLDLLAGALRCSIVDFLADERAPSFLSSAERRMEDSPL